jgi:acyl carrier protein
MKEVINRGGEKIFPAEVEHIVEQISGVIEAAAFALPHRTLGEEMAVAVVHEGQADPCVKAVEERLYAALGRRGLPRRVFFIDHLPRTETGKVKRGELAQRLGRGEPQSPSNDIPSSPFVTALASIWSVLLGVQHFGATDNFFMLGGDSLTGARLLAQVEEVFGVTLPSDTLYRDGATVLDMAKLVESASRYSARSA